ncbi:unnamed protein product [Cyprideis torosa]|uniref:Uncharacterized protein n=1 Tax=Cyprideis torosa TaxID=163714 RepID=A0A7R8W6X0_9CRUS|nr:unnamed protein product [Cyprideis torosa]CAG0886971.1 unnamed protein product [Cyprideis torosa]
MFDGARISGHAPLSGVAFQTLTPRLQIQSEFLLDVTFQCSEINMRFYFLLALLILGVLAAEAGWKKGGKRRRIIREYTLGQESVEVVEEAEAAEAGEEVAEAAAVEAELSDLEVAEVVEEAEVAGEAAAEAGAEVAAAAEAEEEADGDAPGEDGEAAAVEAEAEVDGRIPGLNSCQLSFKLRVSSHLSPQLGIIKWPALTSPNSRHCLWQLPLRKGIENFCSSVM